MDFDRATEAVVPLSLIVEVAAEKYDERVEEGRILAQEPPAGGPIKRFRKVKVVTSLGPKVYRVPDLRGQQVRSALIALEAEGLRAGNVAYAHTALAEPDVVVAQDPPPEGESLGYAGVSLLVSRGPRAPVFVMPSLNGLLAGRAADVIEGHGLRIGAIRRELSPYTARGLVTGQYPEAGFPVARGDSVNLVVSN
jgi:serine/threonine-protein kinase